MLDFFYAHGLELSIYGSIGLVVFAVARTANASPLFALVLSATPIFVAWLYLRHAVPGLLPG